jgi:predicted AAA+ superfamily ATPase
MLVSSKLSSIGVKSHLKNRGQSKLSEYPATIPPQLLYQAGWIDTDLRFSHYRDKDQQEVDLVIERGRNIWAVEVKRSASVKSGDGKGLAKLAAQAGSNFKGGILLYSRANCLQLKQAKCFAVPMDRLWR